MKIGLVTACYHPVINGVTRMVDLYKTHLEARGHEVTIFTLGPPASPTEPANIVRSPAISLGRDGYFFAQRYSRQAQKLLGKMDILHCHHLFMSVEMAHRYGSCPIVYTNHTRYDLYTAAYTPFSDRTSNAIMRRVWPRFAGYADVVIAPSASVRNVMAEFGVQTRLEVIPNGVDLRPFSHPASPLTKTDLNLPPDAIVAAYVGRLASEKNLDTLLSQFAIASQQVPHLHLLLVGKGASLPILQKQAKDLGISAKVHFLGAVAYNQVPNVLAAADLFVTASVSEVHPLTVIEAMAAGLPIVGARSPGLSETVVHEQTGLLVTKPEQELANAILQLAQKDDVRKQMGRAAQKASQRFDMAETVTQTITLYEELRQKRPDLARRKPHGRWQRK
ncbi:MAG: glycosyltransferase [Chloroflexota bacterium]